ncbi:hypothetical protein PHYBOEH_000455 [Phytophthora boehmeriae]|uniref:RxLR effector protein n=1 Tax=Phytophthora boehmeriae TaxID=109152 RepID=A0A8T1VDN3_9STRA|nr:hypothetical protein PHYBOEH_000455 [Phytophthora boehmeriae]
MKIKMNKELTLRMPPQSYQQLKMLSKTDDNYKYFVQYYFKYYVKYPSKIPSNLPATAYDEIMKARMYDWLHVKNLSPPQVVKELERTGVAESNAYYIARYYKMWSEEQQRLSKADTDFFLKKYVWKN